MKRTVLILVGVIAAVMAQSEDSLALYEGDSVIVWESGFVASPMAEFVPAKFISDSAIYRGFYQDFAEIFQYEGKIYTKSGRLPGETFTPMVCGGDMAHYRVLLDGVPVAFPQMMQYDLSTQPMWSLGGIEVLPGAHSALYGTGGMAAAFNLITPYYFPQGARTRITIAQGDYNTENLGVALEHNFFRRVMMHVSGTRLKAGGDQPDEGTRLENLAAKVFVPVWRNVSVEGYAQSHRGWIDYYSYGMLSHLRNDNAIGALHLNYSGELSARLTAQIEKYRQHYYNDWSESRHSGDVLTLDLRGSKTVGKIAASAFGEFRSYKLKSTDSGDHNISTFALGGSVRFEPGRFRTMLALRGDRDFQGDFIPSAGLGLAYEISKNFALKSSVGYGFRAPTPNDLWYFSIWGSYSVPVIDSSTGDTTGWETLTIYGSRGDTTLSPERSVNLNISAEFSPVEGIRFSFAPYLIRYTDLIQWTSLYVPVEDGPDSSLYVPKNVKDATLYGAELELNLTPSKWADIALHYSYTYGQDDSTGERLLERPKHFFGAKISGKLTFWDDQLELGLTLNPQYIADIARSKTDPTTYQTYIASVSPGFLLGGRTWFRYKDFEFFVAGDNLTDNKYELYTGEKSLGRRLNFGISWNFRD